MHRAVVLALALLLLPLAARAQIPAPVGGDMSNTTVKATGSSAPRKLGERAAEVINPLDYGAAGVPVDQTGATDTQAAFQAAITAACAATPTKTVAVPTGTYQLSGVVTIPTGCNGLTIVSSGGPVVFIAATANAANPSLFTGTDLDDLKFEGITFDGGYPTNTTAGDLVNLNWPARRPKFIRDEFRNTGIGNGLAVIGSPPITIGNLSATAKPFDTSLTFASVPATTRPGGYFLAPVINPDVWIASTSATQVNLSFQGMTDTGLINARVPVTTGFSLTADALGMATVLATGNTSGLANKMTIYTDQNRCIQRGTRVVSFVVNTSVTIDRPLQCKVPSGVSVAAAGGVSDLLVEDSYFHDLGRTFRTAQSFTYVSSALAHSGDTTMSFGCMSGAGCARVGLIPGDRTAATGLPAGVPANNAVVDQTAVSSPTGTFTVRFAAPLTADVPAGTPVTTVGQAAAGRGFGLWGAYGAWFANPNWLLRGNRIRDTWSSPVFLENLQDLKLINNSFTPNYSEFQGPLSAPSACGVVAMTIDSLMAGNTCRGTTGAGFETLHNVRFRAADNNISQAGTPGLYVCNGHDIVLSNNVTANNGQYVKYALTNQFPAINIAGILLNGSCTSAQPGVMSNLVMLGNNMFDDQQTPTQNYGVALFNHNSTILNAVYNNMLYSGNAILPSDPALGIVTAPPGTDNRIVNPCGAIDQRDEGNVVTVSGLYGPDQWQFFRLAGSTTLQRSSTTQGLCSTSLKIAVAATATPTAAQLSYIMQPIQAQTLADLKYGTPLAGSLVVDFCAKATTPGTYGWGLYNHNAAGSASYASSFTLADTASHCLSFTVPGDTAHGLSLTPTNTGMSVKFDTGSGTNAQTSTCNAWQAATNNQLLFCNTATTLLSTLAPGQTLEISAVRLYPGSADQTPWVPRAAGAELALAQVYYAKSFPAGTAPAQNAGVVGALCYSNPVAGAAPSFQWAYPVQMRVPPSVTTFNPSAANANWRDTTTGGDIAATVNPDGSADNNQTLIGAGVIAGLNDVVCIHTAADASL